MKEFYTVTEAAEALRLSRMTIYNMVGSGRLPYHMTREGLQTKLFEATDLAQIRLERIVEAAQELESRQAVPRI